MPEDLYLSGIAGVLGICRCTWDELYIPELATMNACMNTCTTVVLCSTVAALCLNLRAPKVDNSHTHHTYAWALYCNCLYNWLTCTHRCNDMHPNHVFVEHITSKAVMGLDSDSEWILSCT